MDVEVAMGTWVTCVLEEHGITGGGAVGRIEGTGISWEDGTTAGVV